MLQLLFLLVCLGGCLGGLLGGCASTVHTQPDRSATAQHTSIGWKRSYMSPLAAAANKSATTSGQINTEPAVLATNDPQLTQAAPTTNDPQLTNMERLSQLWQKRAQEGTHSLYPIGPGDVLEISVPGMEELSQRTVRVTGEGMISLPFIGGVQAGGLTEAELRQEVRNQLEDYMYNPQVDLFVQEYRSRQVAVIGAVKKPGLYMLASGADTLFDVLTLAGGLLGDASPRIILIPARSVIRKEAKEFSLLLPSQLADTLPIIQRRGDPIVIDITGFAKGIQQVYLALPARSGDIVMVPGGGDVLVHGWVKNPGPYKFTPGLSVLGAVAAAGGSRFPADNTDVRIIRTVSKGQTNLISINLNKIKKGQAPDFPLQEDDVIELSYSFPKLLTYGMVRFFQNVFNVGAFASVSPP